MGNVYMEADQIRYRGQYRTVQEALDNGGGGGGTSDYTELANKPSINSVTLTGNKSLADLGIQPADVYFDETATLSTSETTTVTFTDEAILATSVIDIAISEWGIVPDNVVVSAGSCVITMPQVETAVTVSIRLYVK